LLEQCYRCVHPEPTSGQLQPPPAARLQHPLLVRLLRYLADSAEYLCCSSCRRYRGAPSAMNLCALRARPPALPPQCPPTPADAAALPRKTACRSRRARQQQCKADTNDHSASQADEIASGVLAAEVQWSQEAQTRGMNRATATRSVPPPRWCLSPLRLRSGCSASVQPLPRPVLITGAPSMKRPARRLLVRRECASNERCRTAMGIVTQERVERHG